MDNTALELLSQRMFRLARDELIEKVNICDFQDAFSPSPMPDRDMGFYSFNFGLSIVDRHKDDQNHTRSSKSLVYYRIWKNANDHIRRIMIRYSTSTKVNDEGIILFMSIMNVYLMGQL
jgi:hypothetical protein